MAVEKPEEYIKFITGKAINFIDMPMDTRRENRQKAKATREPWLTRWFGIGGFGVMQWIKSTAREESNEEQSDLPVKMT
ncbi:YqzE family protein [Paenibacillus albus]|uniref:YqzE family protein n=1 Tax=Paenibacillus albus TaxID=2495582 RepID=A0A3Q8X7M2_9BACL|nr:YqzE family protein [Paenibacillus albus]AZN42163.1 YqzE family protein [Paenibacillus albus]